MVDFAKLREENKRKADFAATQKTADKAVTLDHTPLTFGKYKGELPSDVAETVEGARWLVWAYENVQNRAVCSELLARDCGWRPPVTMSQGNAMAKNTRTYQDDYDDDIPF